MSGPAKLHAVTLIRNQIRVSKIVKETLKALNLTKMHKTVIHKNTPAINGMLARVIQSINIVPVTFDIKDATLYPPKELSDLHFKIGHDFVIRDKNTK